MNNLTVESYDQAYEKGKQARESGNPEPVCQYTPGTFQYKAFADGYCEKEFNYDPVYNRL